MSEVITNQQVIDETRRFFQKVYAWMFLGLMISAATAYFVSATPSLYMVILGNRIVFFGIVIAELVLVFALVSTINRISAMTAVFLFLFYCFLTGLTLSVIFLVYQIKSIGLTFVLSSSIFLIMSIYGFFTKTDLTRIGQVLFMGLIGIIIASIVNFFLRSQFLDYIVSFAGVIIFTGLTAYDTQKIRKQNIIGNEGTPEDLKESIIGALTLYLDFVNLFLFLLRLLGKRK